MSGNGHGHGSLMDTATGEHRRRLVLVLAITLAAMAVQVVGGLAAGSLALLADAGHMATDAAGVAAALVAASLATRPATSALTFGLLRAEMLAALVNALLLGGVAVWVLVEAARRWDQPAEVESGLMLAVAGIGAAANLVSLFILRGGQPDSLNLRGAYLEALGDLLGSGAVIVAGVVIATTGYARADALASVAIGVMILPRAWSLMGDVLDVLLEATPRGVDLDHVRDHIPAVRRRRRRTRSTRLDHHQRCPGAVCPCLHRRQLRHRRTLRRGAGPPGRVLGRPLRRCALHLPAGARRSPGARSHPSPLNVAHEPSA